MGVRDAFTRSLLAGAAGPGFWAYDSTRRAALEAVEQEDLARRREGLLRADTAWTDLAGSLTRVDRALTAGSDAEVNAAWRYYQRVSARSGALLGQPIPGLGEDLLSRLRSGIAAYDAAADAWLAGDDEAMLVLKDQGNHELGTFVKMGRSIGLFPEQDAAQGSHSGAAGSE